MIRVTLDNRIRSQRVALGMSAFVWLCAAGYAQDPEPPKTLDPAPQATPAETDSAAPPNPADSKPSPQVPAATPKPATTSPEIRFSFDDAEWTEVFRWLAELTGKSLVEEATPPGKFSYFDTRKFTLPEAIDVVNSVLLSKGFALIQRDNFLIAADLREGVPPHLVQRVSIEDLPTKARTELVKVLVTLEGLIAEEAKKEFEPMKGPHGTILALPTTNQLLLIDTAKNVQQIVDLIQEIEGDQGKADLKAFPLKYVSAVEVEKVVRDLLGVPQRTASAPAAPQPERSREEDGRDRFREMIMQRFMGGGGGEGDRGRGRGDSRGGPPGSPAQSGSGKGPFVSIDERTNTLFVTATPDKIALVSQVIRTLDVPQASDEADLVSQTPRIEVYPVASGTAEGLAGVMTTVVGTGSEVRVSAHPDGRALIVYATPREHEKMKAVLEQLQSEGLRVEVIPLRNLEAGATATLIKSLLGQKETETGRSRFPFFFDRDSSRENDASKGPAVEADLEQNRLLVRGTEPQITEIRELLSKLGEVGLGSDRGLEASRYRVVPIGDRDPEELVETIERLWNRLETDTPLRIERLPGPAPQIQAPPQTVPQPPSPKPSDSSSHQRERQSPNPSREDLYRVAYRTSETAGKPENHLVNASAQEPVAKQPVAPAKKPVTIVVGPDNLAIASEDEEALDLIENLVNSVARGRGGANSGFALYYLKSASAQDMAYLLDEALYGQVDPFETTTSTTPKARIIPDLRTNALLVVGPPSEQRKIDQLLEVLDRTDPPPTEAMPTPRMIAVKYARASALAQVVRDVFATQIYSSPKQNPAQGAMNFAAGFGPPMNRGRQSGEQENGKMTVGVDEQTNTLIVSAPKPLLDEVERLVATLDEAARDNHRTARVVTLKNARPETVQKALANLLGTRQAGDLRKQQSDSKEPSSDDQQQPDVRDDILRNLLPGMMPGGDRGRDFFRDRSRRFDPFR